VWGGVSKRPATVMFQVDRRRSSQVVEELLRGVFSGAVGSDFYPAYNVREGKKQRCWARLRLRATRKLGSEEGIKLHQELKGIWEEASRWVEEERNRAPRCLSTKLPLPPISNDEGRRHVGRLRLRLPSQAFQLATKVHQVSSVSTTGRASILAPGMSWPSGVGRARPRHTFASSTRNPARRKLSRARSS